MNYEEFHLRSWRGMLWSFYLLLERVLQMLQTISEKETVQMATDSDILAAVQDQGDRLVKLESLTDKIFAMVQGAPADNPLAQQVLDLITAHNADIDATIARDTPADPANPPAPTADQPQA